MAPARAPTPEEAWEAAERAREARRAAELRTPSGGVLTISAGVCSTWTQATAPARAVPAGRRRPLLGEGHGRNTTRLLPPRGRRGALGRGARRPPGARARPWRRSARWPARSTRKDPLTQRHSERVADLAAQLAAALGWSLEAARAAARRRPRARRRQDRHPGRDPAQARPADPRGVRADQGPRRPRRADRRRRAAARAGRVGPPPPRALGRRAATRTGSRARRSPTARASWRVADAWDVDDERARLPRPPLADAEALEECRRSTGGQFAPEVVAALERLLDAGLGYGDTPVDRAA